MDITKELSEFPQWLGLNSESEQRLQQTAKVVFFNENQTIIHKGAQVSGAYLITHGCLRSFTMDCNGNESTLYDVTPGESCLLAINCVFSGLLYPAWVKCISPLTRAVVIPSSTYKMLYDTEKTVRDFTLDVLSYRIFNIMTNLEESLSLTLEQRIASYLLRKANQDYTLQISHQMIASELGTAREVVSRILKRMEKSGSLALSRGKIQIQSTKELNELITSHA